MVKSCSREESNLTTMVKASVVSCLLQVLSDNAFRRVE
eukprot:SAG22_NODE_17289_length_307_cov_3.163462_1_plen_37_part_01